MRTPLIACTGLVFAFVALTGAAGAHPEYEPAIPNRVAPAAPTSCDTCHGPGNTLVLNDFGNLVSAAHTAHGLTYAAWWPDLWQPDADNDGQTNGQELGDPCGTWTMGQPPPRTTNISNPGDLASKSITPHLPSCPLGGGGAGGTGAASASSGAGSGATSGAGKSSAAGPGDAPPTVQTGACASIAPTSAGGAVAAAWLALGLVAVKRRRRR
jgi:hypothetical protein